VRVVVWLVEGTWAACVDAAANRLGGLAGAQVTLLYVTPSEVEEAAEAAAAGLLGRAWHGHHHRGSAAERAVQQAEEAMEQEASGILGAAASRLAGCRPELVHRRGRPEREVVDACTGADLLVVARDGDRSRLGPHSFGHATRFVVDHAPCDVLVVWPGEPPGTGSLPPPRPPGPPPPPPGHGPRRPPPPGR